MVAGLFRDAVDDRQAESGAPAEAFFAGARRFDGEAALGDVAVVDDDRDDGGFIEAVDGDRFDVAPGAVLVTDAVLGRHRHAGSLQALRERRARRRDVVGVHQLERAAPHPLFERVPEEPGGRSLANRMPPVAFSMTIASELFWTRTEKSVSIQGSGVSDDAAGFRYLSYQARMRVSRSSRCCSSRSPCGSRG